MYLILDKSLKVVGTLDLAGSGCPFYDDLRTVQIADDSGKLWNDTLTISVPYGYDQSDYMVEGYHLLHQSDSDGLWYCFRINSWTDAVVGQVHVKQVQAVNLAIWDLAHTILPAATLTNATSLQAFSYALQQSGWDINNLDSNGGVHTETIETGTTAQSAIQQMTTDYSVEIRAYVRVYNGQVIEKQMDIVQQLGEYTGRRIEYGNNVLDITRTGGDDTLYTKLHVYGGTPKNGDSLVSIAPVNGGKDFLVDDKANDTYNNSGKYLEGYVQNPDIINTSGLLTWGKQQLAYYNHPKYNYTVSVAQLDFVAALGDTLQVVDFEMSPQMTTDARVIQLTESEANPTQSGVTLGEFVEIKAVTPADISSLQKQAAKAQQAAEAARSYNVKGFTPDGVDFSSSDEQKRIIVRVYSGVDEVTYQLEDREYVWQKINSDGNHDVDWEAAHDGVGNTILVDSSVVGCLIRCIIDDGNVANTAPVAESMMTKVVNKVASLQNDHTVSILFITDTHYATGGYSNTSIMSRSTDHLQNASILTTRVPIDLVVHGGDLIDGDQKKNELLDNTNQAASALYRNCSAPIFFLNGNHDDGSLYSSHHDSNKMADVLQPADRYAILKKYIGSGFTVNSGFENRLYGYKDFPGQKVRALFLNTFQNPYITNPDGTNKYISQDNEGIMQDQLAWLAGTGLKLPASGWSVIIFMHGPLKGTFDNWPFANSDLLDDLLSAFVSGSSVTLTGTTPDYEVNVTADFTAQGAGNLIAILSGHVHYDSDMTYNGMHLIQTLDSMARNDYSGQMPDRPYPSDVEDAWDVITIDTAARKLHLTRFGAGSDREFAY